MPAPKINKDLLRQMLADGKTVNQCAEFFNVSAPAISKAKKQLGAIIAKDVQLESAHKFVDEHLNTMAQLREINNHAHELLNLCMRWVRGDQEAIELLRREGDGHAQDGGPDAVLGEDAPECLAPPQQAHPRAAQGDSVLAELERAPRRRDFG